MFEDFREKERKGWGSKAEIYADHTARVTTQAIPTLLRAVRVRADCDFLDICTGPGYAAGAANALCARSTGIDFAPEMIQAAKRNFPNCNFREGDALNLDIKDASFDAAVCPFGLFHVTNPALAIQEAYRVLRPNGRYAFSQWCAMAESDFFQIAVGCVAKHADMTNIAPAPDAFHFSDRDRCIETMAAAGFNDIEIQEVSSVYHAPKGDYYDGIMHLTVRGKMIIDFQTESVIESIRAEMNNAAAAFSTDQGIVVPSPSFVVSGKK